MPNVSGGTVPYPDGVPKTFIGAFRHWIERIGDSKFLKCGEEWVTWRELDETTDRAAIGLESLGISKGTRMCYLASTSMGMLEVVFAAAKLGAVQIPLNIFLKGEFLRYQIAHSRANTVVVDSEGLVSVIQILGSLPDVTQLIVLDDSSTSANIGASAVVTHRYSELRAMKGDFVPPPIQPSDIAQVLYTSGTTGPSKGCLVSNSYLMRVAASSVFIMGAGKNDIRLCTWTLNHIAGSGALAEAVLLGIPIVMEPHLVMEGFIERAARDGITYFVGMGPVVKMLMDQPPRSSDRDHNIRMALLVPCPVETQKVLTERYGFAILSELWAQTECSVSSAVRLDDPDRRPGTSGRPLPDLEITLLDDGDLPVETGEAGEICIRPRVAGAIFGGYLDDPVATLKAMGSLWYHSGDMGRFDTAGNLTFVDRKKDMLRRSGENVSSFELEASICRYPDVRIAAVHETEGVSATVNEIVAWITLEPGTTLDREHFVEFLWDEIPYFAMPRYIKIVEQLPMTVSGRVEKFELRKRELGDDVWDLKALGLLTPRDRRR